MSSPDSSSTPRHSVLVLGAGQVVRPLLDELFQRGDTAVEVAALNIDRARELVADSPLGSATALDASDEQALHGAIAGRSAVVSLLPADQHVRVARGCLIHRVPLITSSYVSDAMRQLDEEAREAGVLLLNETGLDPGIDHMMAVDVIRRVRREGGDIESFESYCGGLPAPEHNNNPWGYKLSWTPRGVLLSARSNVQYLQDGQEIAHSHPYAEENPRLVQVPSVGTLEAYPTRDSLKYRSPYALSAAQQVFRGTFRYPGWSETLRALLSLQLLELTPETLPPTTDGPWSYRRWMAHRLQSTVELVEAEASKLLGLPVDHAVFQRLRWLGIFDDDQRLDPSPTTPLDRIATLFQRRLQYAQGEKDMVALEHHFIASYPGGERRKIVKRLLTFGTAGDYSAMARTVGIPAALATGQILDGKVDLVGVQIPIDEALSQKILEDLSERGFEITETEESLP
ncbi:MAG: saccharopine dehydrogenase C-terminal domain-containing protein [Acidobacteriota bacterium]